MLRALPVLLLLAESRCDADSRGEDTVHFREDVGVIVHLDQLAQLPAAMAACDKGDQKGATAWLYTVGAEEDGAQAFSLQVDAIAPAAYVTCLGKKLEELGT